MTTDAVDEVRRLLDRRSNRVGEPVLSFEAITARGDELRRRRGRRTWATATVAFVGLIVGAASIGAFLRSEQPPSVADMPAAEIADTGGRACSDEGLCVEISPASRPDDLPIQVGIDWQGSGVSHLGVDVAGWSACTTMARTDGPNAFKGGITTVVEPDLAVPDAEVHWLKVRYLGVERLVFVVETDLDISQIVNDFAARHRQTGAPEQGCVDP